MCEFEALTVIAAGRRTWSRQVRSKSPPKVSPPRLVEPHLVAKPSLNTSYGEDHKEADVISEPRVAELNSRID